MFLDGSVIFEGKICYSGNNALLLRDKLINQSHQEREEWLSAQVLGDYYPQIIIDSCCFKNVSEDLDQPLSCLFKGKVRPFGVTSGSRLFFNPAVVHRETAADIPKETERIFPFNYNYPFTFADTVSILLPAGYHFEAAPGKQDIQNSFGRYLSTYIIDDNQLMYVRMMRIDQKLIPLAEYQAYLSFIKTAVKTDNSKFVLKLNP